MKKVIDVDKILEESVIEIKLKGKTFKIYDVSEELVEMFDKEGISKKTLLKEMLGCEDADLDGCGMLTIATIIGQVTSHFFQASSLKGQLEDLKQLEQSLTSSE